MASKFTNLKSQSVKDRYVKQDYKAKTISDGTEELYIEETIDDTNLSIYSPGYKQAKVPLIKKVKETPKVREKRSTFKQKRNKEREEQVVSKLPFTLGSLDEDRIWLNLFGEKVPEMMELFKVVDECTLRNPI